MNDFVLQDTRSTLGDCLMFWRDGGGYTASLDDAERFSYERAESQHVRRHSDVPWPLAYLQARAVQCVDSQLVDRGDVLGGTGEAGYAAKKGVWSGNDLLFLDRQGALTPNLKDAVLWVPEAVSRDRDFVFLSEAYAKARAKYRVPANLLKHAEAMHEAGKDFKLLVEKRPRYRPVNCHYCGRFLSEYQVYSSCPNCDASNAP